MGEAPAQLSAPAAPVLCPECGNAVGDCTRAREYSGRLVAWWLPRAALLAVLALFIGGAALSQHRWSSRGYTSTQWQPGAGHLTISDLKAIADGSRDGAAMLENLRTFAGREWLSGDQQLQVRLVRPEGIRLEGTLYGWPTQIAVHSVQAQYEDALAQTGPVARDWGISKTEFWNNRGSTWSGAPRVAIDSQWQAQPANVALAITLVLAGWYLGAVASGLWIRVRKKPPRHGRILPLVCAGAVLAAICVGTLATPERSAHTRLQPLNTEWVSLDPAAPALDTGWQLKDLRDALTAQDSAGVIARRLLSTLPADGDGSLVLDLGLVITVGPYSNGLAGYPSEWLMWEDTPQNGWPGILSKPGLHINDHRLGEIGYTRGDGVRATSRTIMGPELAMYVLMAWLSWHTLRGLASFLEWMLARRRRSRAQCVACGYDLAGLRTAAAGA
jgi:hypothetical protein